MRRNIIVLALFILLLSSTFVLCSSISKHNISYGAYVRALRESSGQDLVDPSLKVELFFKDGIKGPATSMAFLGPDDILLLEKNTGKVQRIINGTLQPTPLLQVKVGTEVELGMLGIAISKNQQGRTFAFLYYTEANS